MLSGLLEKLAVKLAEKVAPIIAEKLSALLPVIVAAVAKALGDQLKQHIPDLQVPGVPQIAETVRQEVNKIPDIDIPVLSDVFDLTEWLKGKAGGGHG